MNSSPGSPWRPRRDSSSVSGCSGPTDAVPVRTGRPSVVCASIVAVSSPAVVSDAWTCSPATTMFRKWALMQPCSNHAWPHTATASGSNWLKCVGPSIGAPARPREAAVSPSWTLGWPS